MGNYGSTMGNYWELWDNFGSSMGDYGEIWRIMGYYGVLWGIMGNFAVVVGVFLIPFVLLPHRHVRFNFSCFQQCLVRSFIVPLQTPREYLSQGHLARVMKKLDIKCVNNTEIDLAGAGCCRGGGWVSCTARTSNTP